MNNAIPFFIALYIGVGFYKLITRRRPWMDPVDLCASFLIGVGVCGYLTFLQIIIFGEHNPIILIGMTLLLMLFVFIQGKIYPVEDFKEKACYISHWPII